MTNKFRVWDKITQSYSGGDLWSINASGQVFYGNAEWNECVVEWFIGYVDKNSKEIYEGDIVKCMFGEQHQFDTTVDIDDIRYINEYVEHADVIEVVGNIHDKETSNDK